MNLRETVSVIELIWTMGGSLGFLMHLGMLRFSIEDKLILNRRGAASTRHIVVDRNIVTQSGYAIVQALFITLGVYSMTIPPSTSSTSSPVLPGLLIIGAEAVLVILGIVEHVARALLLGQLDADGASTN